MRLENWQVYILVRVPFIQLGYTALCGFFSKTETYKYLASHGYISNLLSYSFFTALSMVVLFSSKKFCFEVKLAAWGCLLMNISSQIIKTFKMDGTITIIDYGVSYDLIIYIIVTLVLMRYLFIRLMEYVKK